MMGGLKGQLDCIEAFSESDFTGDLRKIDVPALITHGDDDQIVPIGASALMSSNLVPNAPLKIYPGAPHGLAPHPKSVASGQRASVRVDLGGSRSIKKHKKH